MSTDDSMSECADEKARKLDALSARVLALEAKNARLEAILWMAVEWFKHGGDECTDASEYRADLIAAGAGL